MSIIVHRCPVSVTLVCYSAWEPSSYSGPHSTVMSFAGKVYGKVGTKRIPPELEALPAYSMERANAVSRWYNEQKEAAYAAIIAKYPHAAKGARDGMGEIEVVEL